MESTAPAIRRARELTAAGAGFRPGGARDDGATRAAPIAWALLAGVVVLAAVLRLALLAQPSLWLDEAFVVWVAQHPWGEIPRLLRTLDQHPPAYYLLMHAWERAAGTGEAAVRLPSACFSVATVALTYALVRRVAGNAAGVLSAVIVAVSPFHVMSAQEARMYPLLGLVCVASTLAVAAAASRGGAGRWAAYAAAAILMVYTHYLGLLVLGAHGVWVAGWARRHLGAWLICAAAAAAAFAPWVPSLAQQIREVHSFEWYRNPSLYMSLNDLLTLVSFGGYRLGTATYFFLGQLPGADQLLVLLPFLALLGLGVLALARVPRALALLGLPVLATVGGMLVVSAAVRPMFVPRWFSFLMPFFAAFLAAGIDYFARHLTFPRARAVAVLVGVLLLYEAPVLDRYYFDPASRPFQWRAAAAAVRGLARPGDGLVFVGTPASLPFRYYFPEPYPSIDALAMGPAAAGDPGLARFAVEHRRLWIVAAIPFPTETRDRLIGKLGRAYRVDGARNFAGAIVYLISAQP